MFRVRSSLAQDFEQTLFCPQNVNHKPIIGNKNLSRKGNVMSVEDEEKRRRMADLADARTREEKSRAARNKGSE